jgi:NACHT domain
VFSDDARTIKALSDQLIALKLSLQSGVELHTDFVSSKMLERIATLGPLLLLCKVFDMLMQETLSANVEYLERLNPTPMDPSLRLGCLNGTRQDTLEFVSNWLMAPSDDQNILWLHGVPGCGKSTISTTIAQYFRDLGRLGAFLFFNRNNVSDETNTVIRTLSYQLASFDPVINAAVCAQIERNPTIVDAPLHDQFVQLLQEPLHSHPGLNGQGPVVIIFDALDECGDPESREKILTILSLEFAKLPPVFRFFITSRAEIDIATAFMNQHNIMVSEIDVTQDTSDISLYLHHSLATIRQMFALEIDWPGEERILALTGRSEGLFVFASTAIKFIEGGPDPNNQLDIILQWDPSNPESSSPESKLDTLYATVLSQMPWKGVEFTLHFQSVMGAIVVGMEPLSDTSLDRIIGMDIETTTPSAHVLSYMGSLLSWKPGQGVRLLHSSFADYLTDPDRCGNRPWFIGRSMACQRLAVGCIRIMKTELKFNIGQLDTSFLANDEVLDLDVRIGNLISPQLKYACCFWADHLQTTISVPEIAAAVEDFLSGQFLYWLEVMSLVKKVAHASQALQITARWAGLVGLCFPIFGHALQY